MTEVLILGRTCHLCSLYGDRTKDFDTERGVFFHLLRHRDTGHLVPGKLLDRYDPEFDPARLPTHDPNSKGRGKRNRSAAGGGYVEPINSYAADGVHASQHTAVTPERSGKTRGRVR